MSGGGWGSGDGPLNARDTSNDDLFGTTTAQQWGRSAYGGNTAHYDEAGHYVPGSAEGFAQDAGQHAANYDNRAAPTLDYGAANSSLGQAGQNFNKAGGSLDLTMGDRANADASRGQESHALDLQRGAAEGTAPSAAEQLQRNTLDQGFKQQLAAGASAQGGPLAQMAAQRAARAGGAAYNQQAAGSLGALRANEMATARDAYQRGAEGIRTGDIQSGNQAINYGQGYTNLGAQQGQIGQTQADMAKAAATNEFNQRQLNDKGRQFYDDQAYNIRNSEANRGLEERKLQEARTSKQQDIHQQEVGRNTGVLGSIIGGASSFLGGLGSLSDVRSKEMLPADAIVQGGSNLGKGVATLARGHAKRDPSFLDSMKGDQPRPLEASRPNRPAPMHAPPDKLGITDHWRPGTQLISDEDAASVRPAPPGGREDPYASGTPGGITREDPYGSGEVYFSDARAKKLAWQEGHEAGVALAESGSRRAGDGVLGPAAKGQGQVVEAPRRDPIDKRIAVARNEAERENELATGSAALTGSAMVGGPAIAAPAYLNTAAHAGSAISSQAKALRLMDEKRRNNATPVDSYEGAGFTSRRDRGGPSLIGGEPEIRGNPPPAPRQAPPIDDYEGATLSYGSDAKSKQVEELERDANRRMAGSPWSYRDEYRQGDEEPGQLHYGTTTQKLEGNPITATAVRKDPKTGLGAVDMPSLVQAQGAGIAALQKQVDELRGQAR